MPRKKTTTSKNGAAPTTAARRTTRRQTMQNNDLPEEEAPQQLQQSIASASPPEPAPEPNITEESSAIEDIHGQDGIYAMKMEVDGEQPLNGIMSDENCVPIRESESTSTMAKVVHLSDGTAVGISESVAMSGVKSETDQTLVAEIETAITKIKIESEVSEVHLPPPSPPPATVIPPSANKIILKEEQEDFKDCNDSLNVSELDAEDDSLSIRRSSRIKTISKTKQKSRGHGLVRDRERNKLTGDCDSPTPTTNTTTMESTATPILPPPAAPEEQKPQKIKTRWLDSAKRESLDLNDSLTNTTTITGSLVPESPLANPVNDVINSTQNPSTTPPPPPVDYYAPDPEVIQCLKRLNQIKDNIYTCERNISKEAKKMTCDCFLTAEEKQSGELACGEDCLNRMLMIECSSRCVVGDRCTNRRFQMHQYAPVVVFKTEMKGFGLRAASDIQGGEFIMEYVGEVLNAKQFEKRANAYSKDKNKHYYFMALRSDAVIDATSKGNISRFINHSCDPNAETQKWTVNGELRIGFFTTRFIPAGEEVTFDYQYQRYGKEAQKCFCQAETCRGWIGEEPDDEDEEEEDEDEDEEEDGEGDEDEVEVEVEESGEEGEEESESEGAGKGSRKEKGKKKGPRVTLKKKAIKTAAGQKKAKKTTTTRTAKKSQTAATKETPKKPRKTARSRRLEMLDELDLDAEIEALSRTGLKNQAHTLKLSRVMVRAKVPKTRMRLLALIQGGEVPCRRLFLDYHGLRLLHGWMADAQEQKDAELKMELLRTLHSLPIPNKTMLKESHVLTAVSNYGGLKLDGERKEIVSEEPPLEEPVRKERVKVEKEGEQEKEQEQPMEESGAMAMEDGGEKMEVDVNKEKEKELEEEEQKLEQEREEAEIRRIRRENEMRGLCKEMVLKWVQLPEVFRIPKKERIEQMKEHEREADMQYMTLNMQSEEAEQRRQNERFKGKNPDEIKWVKREFKVQPVNDGMSKNQRRRLFAMQVEEQRRMQQRMDAWQHHEFRCNFFGLDPFRVRPEDVPSWVDLENRQWFTYDLTEVSTPPNYMHVTMKPPDAEPANIADYEIPPLDLPEGWEYAMDPRGRLFYFHKKIRIPQWELPIKLLPLSQEKRAEMRPQNGYGMSHGMDMEDEESDRNDDSSTTDTCDSSEEEMVKRINRIKKLKKFGVARSTIVKLHLHERNSDDEVTKEEVNKAGEEKATTISSLSRFTGESKKLPNRESLVEYREISPRREEDKLYGQAEMKRYKETKEKFKQRKEMLKRRKLDRLMKAGLINSDAEKRASFRSIQITDDELYDETDDEEGSGLPSQLNGELPINIPLDENVTTTTVPLLEKIVLESSRVDELDEPNKYNEMTRLKVRDRSSKRSRALKVQMKLKKMKMDEEHGEGRTVNGLNQNHQHGVNEHVNGGGNAGEEGVAVNGERLSLGGGTPTGMGLMAGSASSISSERAKRIKDKFRANIAGVIVQHLSPYRKDSCSVGRITNNNDFKHLAKKLTHFVLVKELKHCATVADLSVSDSVKQKSKEFIRKYMGKYGKVYEKPENEPEY